MGATKVYVLGWVRNNPKMAELITDKNGVPYMGDNLVEIEQKRRVSGDLVFNLDTGEIVQSDYWLFDWEVNDSNCWARKMMRANATLEKVRN